MPPLGRHYAGYYCWFLTAHYLWSLLAYFFLLFVFWFFGLFFFLLLPLFFSLFVLWSLPVLALGGPCVSSPLTGGWVCGSGWQPLPSAPSPASPSLRSSASSSLSSWTG